MDEKDVLNSLLDDLSFDCETFRFLCAQSKIYLLTHKFFHSISFMVFDGGIFNFFMKTILF